MLGNFGSPELQRIMDQLTEIFDKNEDDANRYEMLKILILESLKAANGDGCLTGLMELLVARIRDDLSLTSPFLWALDSFLVGNTSLAEKTSILPKLFRLTYIVPTKDRVVLMLKVLPAIYSKNSLPSSASEFLNGILNAGNDTEFDTSIGSEVLCVLFNNPSIFKIEEEFVRSVVVWTTVRSAVTESGMICLRALNALENLIGFCVEAEGFDCSVVADDGEILFSWNAASFKEAADFWQLFLAMFTSMESSQSAHVIDPFLARISHLFSAWSSLNISDFWLEVLCRRACNFGNVSIAKRFVHELLRLDFINTNPRALKFLPKVLAEAFTEHKYFAIAHSPTSTRFFVNGNSFAEELHPIFTDLRHFFSAVFHSNLPTAIKRDFLSSWLEKICHSIYSAPTLSYMLFASSLPIGTDENNTPFSDELRIIDKEFLLKLRETVTAHLTSSESEIKFVCTLSIVRFLVSFVNPKSLAVYDVFRFVENMCLILDGNVTDFMLKTMFVGLMAGGISIENEFDGAYNRLMAQENFDEVESSSFNKFCLQLLTHLSDNTILNKMTQKLTDFIESVIGKLSTNPYLPFHRVLFALDGIFSLISDLTLPTSGLKAQKYFEWCKMTLSTKCEDICLFFTTQLSNFTSLSQHNKTGLLIVWKKMIDALPVVKDHAGIYEPLTKCGLLLIEQFLASPKDSTNENWDVCSAAVLLLSVIAKWIPAAWKDLLTPTLLRLQKAVEAERNAFGKERQKSISRMDIYRLKNMLVNPPFLHRPSRESIIFDLNDMENNADAIGSETMTISNVFRYCHNLMSEIAMKHSDDGDILEVFSKAVHALLMQVMEVVETAQPDWREILKHGVSTFFRRPVIERFQLMPSAEKFVEGLYAICQSRNEIWQILLHQFGSNSSESEFLEHTSQKADDPVSLLFIEVFVKSLLFGQIGRRIRYFAESYYAFRHIYAQELGAGNVQFDRLISQQMVSPAMIRLQAMSVLSSSTGRVDIFVLPLINRLIDENIQLIEKKFDKRPFTNSQAHRNRHRVLVAIIYLLGRLDRCNNKAVCEHVYERLWQLLMVRILQKECFTSVRFLAQWAIVLLLSNDTNKFFDQMLQAFDKAIPEQRYFLICCYIDILSCGYYFLVEKSTLPRQERRDGLMKIFDRILPACLYNHFVTRARAQAALIRLWSAIKKSDHLLMPGDFDSRFIERCVAVASDELNKPVVRNLNNFFYRIQPITDYFFSKDDRLMPILAYFLPRSTELFVDEFAFYCDFTTVQLETSQKLNITPGLWLELENQFGFNFHISKPDDIDDLHKSVSEELSPSGIIQRKLTNWRKLLPCFDEEEAADLQERGSAENRQRPCSDLILVSSLIDKASNLGGLCRSADIFGLSTVTLPSLDTVKDRDFESLSVSAHKWLKIIEIPPPQLTAFLLSLKKEGYTLIAAEQATESISLPEFGFPKKTALILGNEREGIPAHILQLVDNCVEIPQFGIAVRSLNVHVTGALFMYTYTCQHAKCQ